MSKLVDMTGQRFGKITVIERQGSANRHAAWLGICDCGNPVTVRGTHLRTGHTISCGCLSREILTNVHLKHGDSKNGMRSREYQSWTDAISRCTNENDSAYKNYGGRGIRVCDSWRENYVNFLDDMGRCPDKFTLERKDVNGDYEHRNCIWVSRSMQSFNQRKRKNSKADVCGVYFKKDSGKYMACITCNYKYIYLGLFDTLEQAIEVRKEAELQYYGTTK